MSPAGIVASVLPRPHFTAIDHPIPNPTIETLPRQTTLTQSPLRSTNRQQHRNTSYPDVLMWVCPSLVGICPSLSLDNGRAIAKWSRYGPLERISIYSGRNDGQNALSSPSGKSFQTRARVRAVCPFTGSPPHPNPLPRWERGDIV